MTNETPGTKGRSNAKKAPGSSSRIPSALSLLFVFTALLALLRMAWMVLTGSSLQYADYWRTVEYLYEPGGSLNLEGLFHFSNHHFIASAQLLYWLNIKFFAGSNIAPGLIDIAIVLVMLALLALIIRRSSFNREFGVVLFGLAGVLFFSLSGAWNFTRAMSGAAWLSANLFVVATIYFRSRDKHVYTTLAAIGATMSYGTGLFAWPVAVVVGAIHRPMSQWLKEWPYAIGFIVSFLVVRSLSNNEGDTSTSDPILIAQLAANFLGSSLGLPGLLAALAGWTALLLTPLVAALLILWLRPVRDAAWVAIGLYGWAAVITITQGRGIFMAAFDYPSRYYSLAAMTWLGLTAMLLVLFRSIPRQRGNGRFEAALTYALLIALMAASASAGKNVIAVRNSHVFEQELKEIALHLDVVDGEIGYLEDFTNNKKPFSTTRAMELSGHYPFVDNWNRDCGLLGEVLPEFASPRKGGRLCKVAPAKGLSAVNRIAGIMPDATQFAPGSAMNCIVIADANNKVIGAGTVQSTWDGKRTSRFFALAHDSVGEYRAYVFDGSATPIAVGSLDKHKPCNGTRKKDPGARP